jgi:hypothetical protein
VEKKAAWQTEEAERINILVRHKDAKKIWETIRTIVKKWISKMSNHTTGLNILMTCILGKAIETELLGPQYIEELGSDITKEEIKESILKMKNNKATGFDGIPVVHYEEGN